MAHGDDISFGVVVPARGGAPRVAARAGDRVVDLAALGGVGGLDAEVFRQPTLNGFLALGPGAWSAARGALAELLAAAEIPLLPLDAVTELLPITVGDYVDFYSSLHHATNVGRVLRPDAAPLLPNWRHLPVAYHGRAGTVVVSGTPVRRPHGLVAGEDGVPRLLPTAALDFELELGFVIGVGNEPGEAIRPDDADRHVFGVVLLNDWSARDIQAFEYQPLGPFLGKSFATTISAWVTPLEALAARLVPSPEQEPPPDPYLRAARPWGIDLELEVEHNGTTIARTNFCEQYWTFAQQLAHLTVNGATVRTGDLYGSGAVSGPESGSFGSLIEGGGRFLADGDTVVLRGQGLAEAGGMVVVG